MNWNLESVEELGIIFKASYFLAQKKKKNPWMFLSQKAVFLQSVSLISWGGHMI